MRESVDGALAALTPGALTPGTIMVRPPGLHVVPLAPGTVEGTSFPPQRMEVGLALFEAEELVDIGKRRHRCVSPVIVRADRTRRDDSHLLRRCLRCDKLREIERRSFAQNER